MKFIDVVPWIWFLLAAADKYWLQDGLWPTWLAISTIMFHLNYYINEQKEGK